MQKLFPSRSASQVCLIPRCSRTSFIRFIMLIICRQYVILQRYKILCNIKRKSVMSYCSVNDVKCIWELVSGDFARAGRSHNLVGWAVSPREHLLESCIFIWIIRNLFNRNKSGRCAPYKSKEIRSYESKLSTSGPLRICRLRRRTYFFFVQFYLPMQKFRKMFPRTSSVEISPTMEPRW